MPVCCCLQVFQKSLFKSGKCWGQGVGVHLSKQLKISLALSKLVIDDIKRKSKLSNRLHQCGPFLALIFFISPIKAMHPGSASSLARRQSRRVCEILLRLYKMATWQSLWSASMQSLLKMLTADHVVSSSTGWVHSIRRGKGRPSDNKWWGFGCRWCYIMYIIYYIIYILYII